MSASTGTAIGPPGLQLSSPRGDVRGIALLAHGGRIVGTAPPGRASRAALRMYPFAFDLHRHGAPHGLLVARLSYRVAGYNQGDPVEDVDWAIAELSRQHSVPICLVGHSMGARAVLRAAGAPAVASVAALAPWCPPGEPVDQLAGRTVMIIHGSSDRITSPRLSREYAGRAAHVTRVCRFEIAGSGHAMLSRWQRWQSMVRSFTLGSLGMQPLDPALASALNLAPGTALAVPA